ncbi:MAG: MBL fold metallo-hydrolase [Paenibacillaceae bacterium]
MHKRITEDLFRLTLPYLNGEVNSYLLKGERGFTVVDTGFCNEASEQIWNSAISGGLVIEKVVLTHGHPDHIGLATWFQKKIGVPVIYSRIGYDEMKKRHEKVLTFQGDEHRLYPFNVMHDGPQIQEKAFYRQFDEVDFEPDDVFEDSQMLALGNDTYEALWTPGHSSDHFCFWDGDKKTLLVGDLVLGGISPVIPFWSKDDGNPLQDYFDSLDRVGRHPAKLVLPGHGEPLADLHSRISEIKAGHRYRMEQIVNILDEGEKTAGKVSRELYGDDSSVIKRLMEFSTTLSRLVYLETLDKVQRNHQDGKIYFGNKPSFR